MKISIEDDYLIYIFLTDQSTIESVATITNVNGYLIHDKEGNWLGFRIEKTQYMERKPIDLPALIKNDFLIRKTNQHIDLLFTREVEPANYYEQECHLDITNGEVVGIEIIKYLWNPDGKEKWIFPYMY